ncbi:MAG: Rrf2 family transcriptional regulator [Burkholderiales bacterium]|nr:Rrf2 family transcriptional regulator [Burkholderiales bacterium]MDE2394842.1 Rrf2 family transcriptional regulator [Burkholderiales bacterium]MDE2456151.1 Rrf2 family transcriptional regulator [Burkholderiales bacterium]
MRLSEYTDYTLRVLMYCAQHPGQRVTIAEIAERHTVSKNHLMKVVNALARLGWIETARGRGGGLALLADPAGLSIGEVVRACETDFRLVECFDGTVNECTLAPGCRLKQTFDAALQGFFRELDTTTLADISAEAAPTRHAHARPMKGPVSRARAGAGTERAR